MKQKDLPFSISPILFFLLLSTTVFGQYSETFSVPNKGCISGISTSMSSTASCPANTLEDCTVHDFTGVSWTINGNFTGFDINDVLATNGLGVLYFDGDIDNELCFESPVLDISTVSGAVSVSALVGWNDHDNAEYVDVEYKVDGGAWIQIPNQYGGGTHTVDFSTSGTYGSGTVTQGGINGSQTLSVRVCADSNTASNGESHTLDNVSVPETGVTLLVLPVELISFEAVKIGKEIALDWTTATESNNEKFELEHCSNNEPFKKIGEVEGSRNSSTTSVYSFIHEHPNKGINYYRLKQVDINDHFQHSKVVNVTIENDGMHIGELYPNPTGDGLVQLDISSLRNSNVEYSIYDLTGNFISSDVIPVDKGEHTLNIDLTNLLNGIYLIEISSESIAAWRKLIIN